MAGFVGIDFGSHLVKAAVLAGENSPAEVLRLAGGGHSPALPFVMQSGKAAGAAWEQYLRRRADSSVAFAFRDRVWEAASGYALGGRTVRAADMLTPVCAGIREAIGTALPDAAAVGLSVPDRWPQTTGWALPQALAADGWNPTLLARESVAVLADWLHDGGQRSLNRVLLLSLGAGAASASLLVLGHAGDWQLADTACHDALSGTALRELVIADLAREVVGQMRRDPTESAADDQALHDALEEALHALTSCSECDLHAVLFGKPVTLPFSAARVAQLARPLADRLQTVMADWRLRFSRGGPIDAVLYWGDLSARLPVERTLKQVFSTAETHARDFYCVARGVARLVGLVHAGRLSRETADRCERLPLFPALPACDAFGPAAATVQARVVRLDGGSRRMLPVGDALRFGRDPNADYAVEPSFSQVSAAHAVILRRGSLYVLTDLKSTNGTYINGNLLTGPTPLTHGDTITLAVDGPRFRFENP